MARRVMCPHCHQYDAAELDTGVDEPFAETYLCLQCDKTFTVYVPSDGTPPFYKANELTPQEIAALKKPEVARVTTSTSTNIDQPLPSMHRFSEDKARRLEGWSVQNDDWWGWEKQMEDVAHYYIFPE